MRRYYEITDNKGAVYQLLSNLLHKRDVPTCDAPVRNMTSEEINTATKDIQNYIPKFNYQILLQELNNFSTMKRLYQNAGCNYEKLQIFRIMLGDEAIRTKEDVLQKFIKETFHIENEYIMQLNPREYELIPQFIIEDCDSELNLLNA